MRRRGLSAAEVVLAAALVALVALPLMSLSQSQQRDAAMLEYLTMARARASALVDWALAAGPDALDAAPPAGCTRTTAADGTPELALPVSRLAGLLPVLDFQYGPTAPPIPRSTLFSDSLRLSRVPPSTPATPIVYRIEARVSFRLPAETGAREHLYTLVRLSGRRGLSHLTLPELTR